MTGGAWYCIAKTNTFDSGCSIRVAFEDYFIQFSVRVTYGASAINITRCSLPSSAVFSVRLRESDSQWSVDFYSSIDVDSTTTIADSDYWTSVNTSAGAGEVILVINDITSKFNTEQSGGGVGESLFEIINFGNETEPKYAVVPKNFNGRIVHIFSKGAVASGLPSEDEPSDNRGNIGDLNDVDSSASSVFNEDKILLKRAKESQWTPFNLSEIVGLDIEALDAYLSENQFIDALQLSDALTPILEKNIEQDDRLDTLEALGLSVKEKDGVKYLESALSFYSKGGVASGQPSGDAPSPGGGGGSNVTVTPILTSGEKIATIKVDGVDSDIYAPKKPTYVSELENDAKYVTEDTLADTNTAVAALQTAQATLRTDFDNLNNLLNDDTSGVIDTWNNVVDFLEGYKDSEDLATILSGINAAIADRALKTDLTALATTVGGLADTLATEQGYIDTLQGYFVNGVAKKATADALGNVITDTYATKVALNAVDERVKTLEALGLTLEVKDGVTYVKSKYSFYTLGGLASGEPSSSGGGGGTVGGSNVSFKAELLSGTKIGTITIDNVATNIYAPSALANPYALSFGSKTYDGSAAVTLTAADLGALTAHQDISHLLSKTAAAETYLPLSGGTMIGSVIFPTNTYNYIGQLALIVMPSAPSTLQLRTTSSDIMSAISFHKSAAWYGTLSADTDSNLRWNDNIVIHSGNISSQRVANADTLDDYDSTVFMRFNREEGTNLNSLSTNYPRIVEVYSAINPPTDNMWHQVMIWGSADGGYGCQLVNKYTDRTSPLYYRIKSVNSWGNWYQLARTIDNVASATKLATARTIWGQLFDGSSDVSGALFGATYIRANEASVNGIYLKASLYTSVLGESDIAIVTPKLAILNGNVLIGATSGASDAKLYIAGNFYATGGLASGQPSDRRLKENICTISTTDAVDVLRKLNPIFFKWNALATSLDLRNTGNSVGFIADEYEGLIVNSGRDIWGKYRAIDYTKAIPYLAKGWQIHDVAIIKNADNIKDLRSRVEVLERENRELKQRLNMRA